MNEKTAPWERWMVSAAAALTQSYVVLVLKEVPQAAESVGVSLTSGELAVCVFVLALWLGSALVVVRSYRSRETSAVRRWMRVLLRILGL